METRIYTVTGERGETTLVEAASQSQAISYVVRGKYSARVADTKTVAALMKQGSQIVQAKEQTAQTSTN